MHSPGQSISDFVASEFSKRHAKKDFIPGETLIPITGKVFGVEEIESAVQASLHLRPVL